MPLPADDDTLGARQCRRARRRCHAMPRYRTALIGAGADDVYLS